MPYFATPQRYCSADTVSHANGNSANAEAKMASHIREQATDPVNRTYSRPSNGRQASHQGRPSISLPQKQHYQYGSFDGRYEHEHEHGGSGGGYGEARARSDEYGRDNYQRGPGYGGGEGGVYGQDTYGSQHGEVSAYGSAHGYRPALHSTAPTSQGFWQPQEQTYYAHRPVQQYAPSGQTYYDYRQAQQYASSGQAYYDYRQIQQYAPSGQPYYDYRQAQQAQQYAHPQPWNPAYQPYQQYSNHYSSSLMQPFAASNSRPSVFNASAPAFTPVNAAPRNNAAQNNAQQPQKSVPATALHKRHGVDKQSRYGQSSQPKFTAKSVNPVALSPAFFNQNNPAFFNQNMGPGEDQKQVTPAWHKLFAPGKVPPMMQPSMPQLPVEPVIRKLPRRSPPPSPRSASGKLMLMKRPVPRAAYLRQAREDSLTLDHPRVLLVVLDLNGTLLHRKARGGSTFVERPKVKEFLHYLFTHHKVVVWSSARPENVGPMCDKLFTAEQREQVISVWARDKLRLSADHYNQKVQVYKQLSWIWDDPVIANSCPGPEREWSQENTVLVDDSLEKAASEPHNILKIDEFEAKPEQMKSDVLGQVVRYLEALRWERDVSAYMRWKPFIYEEDAEAYDWMPIINEMH